MANKDKGTGKQIRYPNPLILLLAAVYLGFMAYQLGKTIFDGTVSGRGLVISWIGMIAFILIAIALIVLSIYFNNLNKKAIDEELAAEKEEFDKLDLDEILSEEEEKSDD